MSIEDSKLNNFSFNHADQQDELYNTLTAEEIKEKFDSRAEELRLSLNSLIESLTSITDGNSGADSIGVTPIGGLNGDNIQLILEDIKKSLDVLTLGQIPDDTLTNTKLAPEIKIGSLVDVTTDTKLNVIASINELVAKLVDALQRLTNVENEKLDSVEVTDLPEPNKVLRLNGTSKLPASITADANTVDGKHAAATLNTTEKLDLATAINEVNTAKVSTTSTSTTAAANKLIYTDVNSKLPVSITGDAGTVDGKSATDLVAITGDDMTGNLNFSNNKGALGKNTTGTVYNLAKVNASNKVDIGTQSLPLTMYSSIDPVFNINGALKDAWHDGNGAISQADVGYQKFGSGLILQWGKITATKDVIKTVPFPIAFPTALVCVSVTPRSYGATNYPSVGITSGNTKKDGFDFTSSHSNEVYWLALGW